MRVVVVSIGVLLSVYVLAVLALGLVYRPMRSRPTTERDKFVTVLGSQLAYRVSEHAGPTLILLHGFGGSLLQWDGMLDKLRCGRVISVDLLGFGASSRPSVSYELETHRQYLVGLMDALGIQKAVLVGFSFGGSLALWTTAHTPDRILGAVAIAPSAMPGQLRAPWPRSFLSRPGLVNKIAALLVRTPLFAFLFGQSAARQDLGISGSYGEKFAAAMPRIKQPTLLLWSPGDVTAPYSYRDQYLRAIPQARLVTFDPKSGHAIPTEQPELTARCICELVQEIRGTP